MHFRFFMPCNRPLDVAVDAVSIRTQHHLFLLPYGKQTWYWVFCPGPQMPEPVQDSVKTYRAARFVTILGRSLGFSAPSIHFDFIVDSRSLCGALGGRGGGRVGDVALQRPGHARLASSLASPVDPLHRLRIPTPAHRSLGWRNDCSLRPHFARALSSCTVKQVIASNYVLIICMCHSTCVACEATYLQSAASRMLGLSNEPVKRQPPPTPSKY